MATQNRFRTSRKVLPTTVRRRTVRFHEPGVPPMGEGSQLPVLRPVTSRTQGQVAVPAVQAPNEEPEARKTKTVSSLLYTVIAAVNARGMCAVAAARLADLPFAEIADIRSRCSCSSCRAQRA